MADKGGGSQALIDRGGFYDQLFLRPFHKDNGRTPQSSRHSRSSSNVTFAEVGNTIKKHPTNHSEAKKSALVRDNFRCMVTGFIDDESSEKIKGLWKLGAAPAVDTQCAHIFSESTNAGMEDERKKAYAQNAWSIINAFGYTDVYMELGGANSDIHRLENIMTLASNLRRRFDRLEMWFEAAGIPNSYNVCSSSPDFHQKLHVPTHVTFTTERQDLPLPSPRYLELHAACCRVAHMSGAADYYRDMYDDDPFVGRLRTYDPVGSDFSVVLHARLLDLSERGAVTTVSG